MSSAHLKSLPAGLVSETDTLEKLLARCWDEFSGGDEQAMEAYTLIGPLEDVNWTPPNLTFVIERHGASVYGSARAEPHKWTLGIGA